MHNEETKTTSAPRRAMHGPGGRGGVAEKPKDFGNAIKKMVHYLHDFVPMIIVALVLASLSSVFSIIGPNKLSDLTDTITEGITLDADKLQDVTNEFSSVMDSDRIQTTLTTIATPSLTDHEIETVLEGDFSASVKNSFARFFNTLNFYRAVVNDPNLDFANHYKIKIGHDHNAYVETRNITQKMLKEVKEEVYALSEFLTVSGRISDYSVKFEFLRNLAPNDKDFGPLTFNPDGTVHFNYYNEKALASKGVFIQSDTNFFKRVMNALFDGPIQQETNSALQEFTIVKNMLEEYRKNMVDEIGNLNNFAFPSKVMLDQWNSDGSRIYSSGSPNLRSLYVGTPLDEMISNTAKLTYNTNKWYKMFKGIGLGLLGVTVLSQFFFGGSKKVDKKK